jgi:hypothetical protein
MPKRVTVASPNTQYPLRSLFLSSQRLSPTGSAIFCVVDVHSASRCILLFVSVHCTIQHCLPHTIVLRLLPTELTATPNTNIYIYIYIYLFIYNLWRVMLDLQIAEVTVVTCNSTQGDKIHTRENDVLNVITLLCIAANRGLQNCSDANTRTA